MESFTVTLADTDAHNLHDLLVIADAAKADPKGIDLITEFREILILADKDNGAKNLAIGGSDVTNAIYSVLLGAGANVPFRPAKGKFWSKERYVKASAQPLIFHVEGLV